MSPELIFGPVHFGLEQPQPLVEVVLADRMLNFSVILEGILKVHLGTGILLL